MGRLCHLLLGAHGAAVLSWRAPGEVLLLLLLLQKPLVCVLVKHGGRRLRQRGTAGPSSNTALLLLLLLLDLARSTLCSCRSSILTRMPTTHGVLLHLHLEPLLERRYLGQGVGVAWLLPHWAGLTRRPALLLEAVDSPAVGLGLGGRGQAWLTLARLHETLLARLLLEGPVAAHLLLLLLLLVMKVSFHEQLSQLGTHTGHGTLWRRWHGSLLLLL